MKMLFGLRSKILLMTLGLLVSSISALTYLAYLRIYNEQEKEIGIRLKAIAVTSALMLDGSLHNKVRRPEDAKSPAFMKLRKILRNVKKSNNLDTEIYTFRKDGNRLRFIIMTNKKPYVGDTYQLKDRMKSALLEGKPSYSRIFRDQYGAWISAYAPIRDAKGKVVGILDIDHKLSTFTSELQEKMFWIYIFGGILFFLALWLSISLSGRLVRHVKHLRNVMEELSMGNMDVRINIRSRDEIGELAVSLERLRESLRIAMEMIEEDNE